MNHQIEQQNGFSRMPSVALPALANFTSDKRLSRCGKLFTKLKEYKQQQNWGTEIGEVRCY
jgi:hypothetical protein